MAALTVKFTNNSTIPPKHVHIGFVPGSSTAAVTLANAKDGTPIHSVYHDFGSKRLKDKGNWYTLPEVSDGVTMTSFSGRIYVCYGIPWSITKVGQEPAPSPVDPNFFRRYDKMEITFTGQPSDVANLTSIDYWSIPMSLETFQTVAGKTTKRQTVSGFRDKATAKTLFDSLTALTTPPKSGVTPLPGPDGAPLPALVPGEYVQFGDGPKPGDTFARIYGPSQYGTIYPVVGIPVMPYELFRSYLRHLADRFGPHAPKDKQIKGLGKGVIAHIKGEFAGVGPNVPASGPQSKQAYDYTATIDKDLNILLTETTKTSPTTLLFKLDDLLNPTGIYGGNAPFYFNGASTPTAPANNVYGWISGDLLSGFNIGAVGSPTKFGGKEVGAMNSQDWFDLPAKLFYAGLQKEEPFYNPWAATLSPLSDAYNFAYSDRFAPVFASLNPATVDTLAIVLEDDKGVKAK